MSAYSHSTPHPIVRLVTDADRLSDGKFIIDELGDVHHASQEAFVKQILPLKDTMELAQFNAIIDAATLHAETQARYGFSCGVLYALKATGLTR